MSRGDRAARILLIGLAGAGKTTLGALLAERNSLRVHRLDDLRRTLSDGTEAGEARARSAFLLACGSGERAVYEFSAAGPHRSAVRQALRDVGEALLIAWVDTPASVRRERLTARPDTVPLPSRSARSPRIDEAMESTLRADFEAGWWAEPPGWQALRLDGIRPALDLVRLIEAAWSKAGGAR